MPCVTYAEGAPLESVDWSDLTSIDPLDAAPSSLGEADNEVSTEDPDVTNGCTYESDESIC